VGRANGDQQGKHAAALGYEFAGQHGEQFAKPGEYAEEENELKHDLAIWKFDDLEMKGAWRKNKTFTGVENRIIC